MRARAHNSRPHVRPHTNSAAASPPHTPSPLHTKPCYCLSPVTPNLATASPPAPPKGLLEILAAATEYGGLPLRPGEDEALRRLGTHAALPIDNPRWADPHTKANVLLQVRRRGCRGRVCWGGDGSGGGLGATQHMCIRAGCGRRGAGGLMLFGSRGCCLHICAFKSTCSLSPTCPLHAPPPSTPLPAGALQPHARGW